MQLPCIVTIEKRKIRKQNKEKENVLERTQNIIVQRNLSCITTKKKQNRVVLKKDDSCVQNISRYYTTTVFIFPFCKGERSADFGVRERFLHCCRRRRSLG